MTFQEFGIDNHIVKAVELLGYTSATTVQERVVPEGLQGKDLWVKSQTGSGKTAAFGAVLCEKVEWDQRYPQALVLVPTRELAIQVAEDVKNIGRFKRLNVVPIFGRVAIANQELQLKQRTHIVVGTPGRVRDLIQRGSLKLEQLKYVVIDEADEMFFIGLRQQVEEILRLLPTNRQTMLFSATLSEEIEAITTKFMKSPQEIAIESETQTALEIEQFAYEVEESDKINLLVQVTKSEKPKSCIIFANTQTKVDAVAHKLKQLGYPCQELHGGLTQKDRMKVMKRFKRNEFRYLIATDLAARGIDIDDVKLIINFDISRGAQNYVHRIGRSGRAGKSGKAITFYTSREKRSFQEILDYTKADIQLVSSNDLVITELMEQEFKKLITTAPKRKEEKSKELNQSITKLCIRAGKKDKIRTCEIVATICGIDGVVADDIGIIQILPMVTNVEILNKKGNLVYKELHSKTIKGKKRKVYFAK